jgi:hypothetical protein
MAFRRITVSLSSDWNIAKKAMDKVGVDVKLFKKDFSSTLDDFERAKRKYEEAGGKDPKKLDTVLSELKIKREKAKSVAGVYGDSIQYLYKHATDSKQKSVLDDAGTTVMKIILAIKAN